MKENSKQTGESNPGPNLKATWKNKRTMATKKPKIRNFGGPISRSLNKGAGRGSKYHNKPATRDGFKFHSQKEAMYYDKLKALKENGGVEYFLRQVPFHLPGGVIYRADFLVFWSTGQTEVIDVKGFRTQEYKIKKKLVESLYPIFIVEV